MRTPLAIIAALLLAGCATPDDSWPVIDPVMPDPPAYREQWPLDEMLDPVTETTPEVIVDP